MSCPNCMNYKPEYNVSTFTCPECGQVWKLAKVWPGRYWEKSVIHQYPIGAQPKPTKETTMKMQNRLELQDRMKKYGIKQKDIAEKANVSPTAISLVSRGLSVSKRVTDIIEREIKKKQKELMKELVKEEDTSTDNDHTTHAPKY